MIVQDKVLDEKRLETSESQNIEVESKIEIVKKGMILPFQHLALTFEDMSYFVDMPT